MLQNVKRLHLLLSPLVQYVRLDSRRLLLVRFQCSWNTVHFFVYSWTSSKLWLCTKLPCHSSNISNNSSQEQEGMVQDPVLMGQLTMFYRLLHLPLHHLRKLEPRWNQAQHLWDLISSTRWKMRRSQLLSVVLRMSAICPCLGEFARLSTGWFCCQRSQTIVYKKIVLLR